MKVALSVLVLVAALVLFYQSRSTRFTALAVGDTVRGLPPEIAGPCAHVVVTHGTCGLCELTLSITPDATWLTQEAHPRDVIYPRILVSEDAYEALEVGAIPVEFLLHYGEVLYRGSFSDRDSLPECPPRGG